MDQEIQHPTVFDADQQQLGDVYAKALLGFGKENGSIDQLVDQLGGVVGAINELPKFKAALESPRVSDEQKSVMIDKAFGGKVEKDLVNFLKVVASKGRLDCLNSILGSARNLHDEMAGRVQATVTTAQEIDDSVRNKVAEKLSAVLGKTVTITSSVDPGIIGGMVVRIGDTVFDGSVVNQLSQVKTRALKRTTDAIRASIEKFTSS